MKKKILFKIPLLSLAIWLLFLISPLSHTLSHALQDDTTVEPLLLGGAEFSESSLQEETLVGFDVIGLRKMGNGRKRVTAVKRIMKKETTTNDEREEDQQSSRITGLKKKISSNKSLQTSQVNHHQETIDATRSKNSRQVKAKSTRTKRLSTKDLETERLLKEAKEIANLMHKDYKDWARRKPPINNREPLH